jgi:hypothetical protein
LQGGVRGKNGDENRNAHQGGIVTANKYSIGIRRFKQKI